MPLPDNITSEQRLLALEKIDAEGIPPHADSTFYDLIFNEKRYLPKLVISFANLFANNQELDRDSFSGGRKTDCFRVLLEQGFQVGLKNETKKTFQNL
jgi:5-methylcytosine-specific restriction protein B